MKFLFKILFFISFFAILLWIISYTRGYRLDLGKKTLSSTGILSLTSYPKTAQVYLDGKLKGVTDLNLTLSPNHYQVEIKKDGYTSWSKKIVLKGELVVSLEAVLFPLNPSLSPLTNSGLVKAIPIDDTEKILVFVQKPDLEDLDKKNGLYLFEAGKRIFSFFPALKPILLEKNLAEKYDFSSTQVIFSPDYKQAIIEFNNQTSSQAFLLSLEEENTFPFDVSLSKDSLITAWEKEKKLIKMKILETYPKDIVKIASESFNLIAFSPSETKLLYQVKTNLTLPIILDPPFMGSNQSLETRVLKKNSLYVYDKKEDKNYQLPIFNYQLIQWYFDSKHLLINEGKKISVVDYDGTNQQTFYSGPYESDFFYITSDGKLIILANLNPDANQWPDLYLVGIR
ncbi:hypothetical protein CO006_03650 [Candidatus Roizmanbacteria bacterium CG_4_8_14_3_um_filter_35_14]|uniref:PEGA domain-containing protein n=2 Tax=Candidatus Roizmaniibacteriota TaxID=1752723 RepID=A0A2M8F437_9BACT|nr:MAG: hypothetical protein CO048_01405 [Candidatus Roizmanbacteria bacterium CG_4_9_14_0_2_um_filter_35_15]PJC82436.1 MAG: hypothetical protein CO006_03650 [Candidatus Roizmanbacteria bacterium CG_4_8_14_3_um_filter_35_14]